jgi:hypothetical protein
VGSEVFPRFHRRSVGDLNTAQKEAIEREIYACLSKAQRLNAIFFWFGVGIKRKYRRNGKYGTQWDSIFPGLRLKWRFTRH